MGVTIKHIAKELNISTASVSKALNDKPDVSDALKKKVKDLANEMGYSPNYFAKNLVTNKSNVIGVFILGMEDLNIDEFFALRFIDGIIDETNKNNYDVLLFSSSRNISYKKICEEKMVEGVIFIGMRLDDPYIEDIKNIKVPVSIIDLYIEGENINFISSDNSDGVNKAMEYLWNLGHRNIAIIGSYEESQIGQTRYEEYKRFLIEKGEYTRDLVFKGDFTRESGYNAALEIMRRKELPDAVFAISDLMAVGAIQAFSENGLRVPEDISVLGFDNISIGEYIKPALTTIAQDTIKIGRKSVKAIFNNINKSDKENVILIEPELIVRDSCKENDRRR